jgi:ADP-ribose diphosphatase
VALELTYSAGDVRLLQDEVVYAGYFKIRKVSLQHRRFDGSWSEPVVRELFERGDAVGVLPYDPVSDSVILIEQFRPGAMRGNASPWMLELIAGIVDSGEQDESVAHREAMEEAGCTLSSLEPVATVFPSSGACTEQVRLFCGRLVSAEVGAIRGLAEEGEDILVHQISRADAMQLLADDKVPNGHTLIALQWLCIHGDQLRERWG